MGEPEDRGFRGAGKREGREIREGVKSEVKVRDCAVQTEGLPSFGRLMSEIEVVWMLEETPMVPRQPCRVADRGWGLRVDGGVRRDSDPSERLDRGAGYPR
jgi:hypothetical protein